MDGGLGDRGLGMLINWQQIGLEFRRAGFGPSYIAKALNIPRETVRSWFERNVEPGYTDGHYLVRLHARVVSGKNTTDKFAVKI